MAKVAEPQNNAYTGLLAISLVAMVVACGLLYMDYSQYEGKTPPPTPKIEASGTKSGSTPIGGTPKQDTNPNRDADKKGEPMSRKQVDKPEMDSTVSRPTIEIPPMAPASIPAIVPAETTTVSKEVKTTPAPTLDIPKLPELNKTDDTAIKMPEKNELIIPVKAEQPKTTPTTPVEAPKLVIPEVKPVFSNPPSLMDEPPPLPKTTSKIPN